MKILIISLPRCGSTNLLLNTAKKYNLKGIFEPFDGSNREQYNEKMKNIVVKTIVGHQTNSDLSHLLFLENLSKQFNQVILLSRKDLISCAQSHAYVVYNKERKKVSSISEYYWEPTPIDELCLQNIIDWDNTLKKLSEKIIVPITYYEDIYDVSSNEKLRKGDKKNSKIDLL